MLAAIDKSNSYGSVAFLARQAEQAWKDTQQLNFPEGYRNVQNIVLCGMGGSAYAALVIKALYNNVLQVPFELVNGYTLPSYVNEKTLVLLSSYSGSTEEVLLCADQALEKGAKIAAVTNGSKLGDLVKLRNIPAYIFNAVHNPAKQPRLGQGYMIFGHLGILNKIGLLSIQDEEVAQAIAFIDEQSSSIEYLSKDLAPKLLEKIPVIIAAEHLAGNAHTMRNQINETAKNFATYSLLPELNHHLMEGLVHPTQDVLVFLLLKSTLYAPVIQKRLALTADVVEKNKRSAIVIDVLGDTPLQQMLYALTFGGYLSFYFGISYNQDPSLIPWVNYFKSQLSK